MKTILNRLQILLLAVAAPTALSADAFAQSAVPVASTAVQTPAGSQPSAPERIQPRRPVRRASAPPARVRVIADREGVAPQVVTIVHRLSGVKMLRLLLRQADERGTVATIDPEAITNDAHASIIAGLTLEDGRTIAARLPQAAAELEFAWFPASTADLTAQLLGTPTPRPAADAPRSEPDLTVITRDGRRLVARYVGLDGQTGLSVLQVVAGGTPPPAEAGDKKIEEGQRVQLFAPERVTTSAEASPGIIYVRTGEVEAKIASLARANSGKLEQLTVRSTKLTPAVIGAVACDELGNTLGIVEAIEGNDARIVPADTIRAAARRVLERQTSVPRPLLGVRGEAVGSTPRTIFLAQGWREDQLAELVQKQLGILLTSVLPGTPAAQAKLHPGDVIVRVNDGDVRSAEDFSALLSEAGSGEQVHFTVRRPNSPDPLSVAVKLGGSFEPMFKWHFEMPFVTTARGGLEGFGVEAVALSAKSASQLGAQGGLLVVAVQPESVAARSGMREGDVIESIDGRLLGRGTWAFLFSREKKHLVSLVRDHEKKQVVLEVVE
jgi:S1-C subfamily serine protease